MSLDISISAFGNPSPAPTLRIAETHRETTQDGTAADILARVLRAVGERSVNWPG